ncbi:MAG: hypothetical protein ACR2RE_07640 [Geminicoccaceae bacterium]
MLVQRYIQTIQMRLHDLLGFASMVPDRAERSVWIKAPGAYSAGRGGKMAAYRAIQGCFASKKPGMKPGPGTRDSFSNLFEIGPDPVRRSSALLLPAATGHPLLILINFPPAWCFPVHVTLGVRASPKKSLGGRVDSQDRMDQKIKVAGDS